MGKTIGASDRCGACDAGTDFERIRRRLRDLLPELSPQMARAATYILENPSNVPFLTVRALADAASVNPSTIVRVCKVAGFPSFAAFREAYRDLVRPLDVHYGERAAALAAGDLDEPDLARRIAQSACANVEQLVMPTSLGVVRDAARVLVSARRVFITGFRSSFALAYYLAYAGRMAFSSVRLIRHGGLPIMDELADMTPEDAFVIITFRPYSTDALKAADAAHANNVPVVCITDRITAPIARGASHVIEIPMAGPQYLPSLVAATAACEILLGEMVQAAGEPAIRAIGAFEDRVRGIGGYAS